MLKKDLRIHFLDLRKNVPATALSKAVFRISDNAQKLPIWDLETYHIYLHSTQKKELDTQPLISLLREKKKQIVVPRITADNQLQHFLLTENTLLKPNNWGIPEPVNGTPVSPLKIDVVFIPLLAFDMRGHRVGYGKGYYDRFLSGCRKECIKIGLSLFEAVDEITDAGKYDVRLDYCLTPEKIYAF